MFDADAYLATAMPPSLKVGGVVYTGKLISFSQVLEFQKRLREEGAQQENSLGERAPDIIKELCSAIDLPAPVLLSLPPGAVLEALQHFFACLLGGLPAQQTPLPGPPPTS